MGQPDTGRVDHLLDRVGGHAGGAAVLLAPDGETVLAQYACRAGDVLFKLVGLDAPQRLITRLGLEQTRVVLPTREYYVIIAGLDPEFSADDLGAATARF